MVYVHHRSVNLTLGHRKQLVLINDYEATKSAKVVVANLRSRGWKQIDKQALAMYRRHVRPDSRLWIVPDAYEFSPNDKQVFIKFELTAVSAATEAESIAASKTYKEWYYAVNAHTGRVLREYRRKPPSKWW